jgi:hypothetical protein
LAQDQQPGVPGGDQVTRTNLKRSICLQRLIHKGSHVLWMFVVLRLATSVNVIFVESDNWMVDDPPLTVAAAIAFAAAFAP